MADQLWGPDGTQPTPPPQVWDDPVAGLVAGDRFDDEQFSIDVVEPVMPDLDEVRRAFDAALSDEQQPPVVPAPRQQPVDAKAVPNLMPPPNPRPGWPRPPSVRQLPGRGKRQLPTPRRPPAVQRVQKVKQPAGARGLATGIGTVVVIVILLVIVILIISGLANTVSDLFG